MDAGASRGSIYAKDDAMQQPPKEFFEWFDAEMEKLRNTPMPSLDAQVARTLLALGCAEASEPPSASEPQDDIRLSA